MALHNFPADGQPQPAAGNAPPVQPPKRFECRLRQRGIETRSVIPHAESPVWPHPLGRDPNLQRNIRPAKPHRVREQIPKNLRNLNGIAPNLRQFPALHIHALNPAQGFPQHRTALHSAPLQSPVRGRQGHHSVHQRLHPINAIDHKTQVLPLRLVKLALGRSAQQPGEVFHGAQRFPQVVRSGIDEPFRPCTFHKDNFT